MKKLLIGLAILFSYSVGLFAQLAEPVHRPVPGLGTMENVQHIPLLFHNSSATRQVSAYDISSGNNDGSYTRSFVRYYDRNGEAVIFDEYGPGCLYRQQMNVWVGYGGKSLLLFNPDETNARIKYYFDDEKKPRLDLSMDDLFAGRIKPFDLPLVFMDDGTFEIPPRYDINRGRFATMYYPFNFSKRLKITFVPNKDWNFRETTWYQNTFIIYPKNEPVSSWNSKEIDNPEVRRQWANLGQDPKNNKGNVTLKREFPVARRKETVIAELKGQGSISSIKLKMEPFTKETFYETNIKIYWDNAITPAVDVPLGYFFGGGGKDYKISDALWKKKLTTLMFGYGDGSFYSYWPMPYWKKARIVIQNNSSIDIKSLVCELQYQPASVVNYAENETGYFHAKRTIDHDTGIKPFCTAFKETGHGHVVGILFYTQGYDMDGDEFTYMDGSRSPQIHGSGTEDDHNQGWAGTRYQKPLWGALTNGYESAYRIYLNDSYIFNKDITINYEYSSLKKFPKGGDSDVTVFYYKSASDNVMKLTDELDVANLESEQAHNYTVAGETKTEKLTSCYDGYEQKADYDVETDDGRAFNGYSQFTVKLDPENTGVKLRRRVNRSGSAVQSAKVYVYGQETGIWQIVQSEYVPISQAWLDSEYEIPAEFTRGKSNVDIKVEYLKSDGNNGEINEFYYWVFCYPKN